jgi:hypothetical protein
MREHRREPGRGSRVPHEDADQDTHHAVGKVTRVEQLSGDAASGEVDGEEEPDAEASRKKYTRDDVEARFNDARTNATYLYNEREHAIQELQNKLHTGAKQIDKHVLARLAEVALAVAGASLQSRLASGLSKGVAFLIRHYLDDKSKLHVPADAEGDPESVFIQMQLRGLTEGSRETEKSVNKAQAHTFNLVSSGKITMNEAYVRARALARVLGRHQDQAYQLQYNVSLMKWFSAIAHKTFGSDRDGASNIDGHLSTDPVAGVEHNPNYSSGYEHKGGFVHLSLKLSYRKALGLEAFTTPGIPNSIWQYHRDDKGRSLGSIPLKKLPGKQRLPVIADVHMVLEAGSDDLQEHLPDRSTGQQHQPVAISWNERDEVHTELPRTDKFRDKIKGEHREWLSEQVGNAVGESNASKAGEHIMRQRIGVHSLEELDQLARSKQRL